MIQESILVTIVLAPLIAAIAAGIAGKVIGRVGAHTVTILGVAISCGLSIYVLKQLLDGAPVYNDTWYTWLVSDGISMEVGFLIDRLSALMMCVVTFVSLCVHVYTIGYMHDDPGYQRFFSYISLFTFSMLMLVMSNNFLQLFFGWEAVGVVSYLLIGFWYTRPSAIFANMKAFLVNRVGARHRGRRVFHGVARLHDGIRAGKLDRRPDDGNRSRLDMAGHHGGLHLLVHRCDG
jgi:NADH-quinone oxidoreductase subunit L